MFYTLRITCVAINAEECTSPFQTKPTNYKLYTSYKYCKCTTTAIYIRISTVNPSPGSTTKVVKIMRTEEIIAV